MQPALLRRDRLRTNNKDGTYREVDMGACRSLLIVCILVFVPSAASLADAYDDCVGFVDTVPTIISSQGTWCLRQNLATSATSINAIEIQTNNVAIDCHGFKLGNLGAG